MPVRRVEQKKNFEAIPLFCDGKRDTCSKAQEFRIIKIEYLNNNAKTLNIKFLIENMEKSPRLKSNMLQKKTIDGNDEYIEIFAEQCTIRRRLMFIFLIWECLLPHNLCKY